MTEVHFTHSYSAVDLSCRIFARCSSFSGSYLLTFRSGTKMGEIVGMPIIGKFNLVAAITMLRSSSHLADLLQALLVVLVLA